MWSITMTEPRRIKLYFSTVDHCRWVKQYKTLDGARKAALKQLGPPEVGSTYAISGDGVCKVQVVGATLKELFPDQWGPE
jgi:hypothetical protein